MAEDMTLLWGAGTPPYWRVMIILEEKGLQGYNHKLLSFKKGEYKSHEVMDLNPGEELPTLKHGDRHLNESYAACLYLESQFKSQGTKLTPDDPDELALMYQRIMEGVVLLQRTGEMIYYNWRVPEEEKLDSTFKRLKESLTTEVKLWEGYLKDTTGSFLAGESFSLADVMVYPSIWYLFHLELSEERYPNLAAYCNFHKDRPSIKTTWSSEWSDLPRGPDTLKDI